MNTHSSAPTTLVSPPPGSFPSLPETIKSQPPLGPHSCHLGVCVCLPLSCGPSNAPGCHFYLLILYVLLHAWHKGRWKCWFLPSQFLGIPSPSFVCPSSLCLYSKHNAHYMIGIYKCKLNDINKSVIFLAGYQVGSVQLFSCSLYGYLQQEIIRIGRERGSQKKGENRRRCWN